MTSTTQFLDTSVGRIAFDERGSGSPIVLLPSGAHTRQDFDEVRDRLPSSVRTIALDWPAHGDSPPSLVPPTAMVFADAAEAAVTELAPEGAVVVGNSIGGYSAARLALRRPELVRALVLVDSGGFVRHSPAARAFCSLMSRPGFLRRIYPAFSARYMRSRTDFDRTVRERAIATTRTDDGLAAVAGLWGTFMHPDHDLRGRESEIAAPTLVVWGRRDPVIPLKVGRTLAEAIPAAKLVVLDTGHAPHVSDPETFTHHLEGLISLSGRPRTGSARPRAA